MDPFLGEVRIMGFDFPPRNWAVCNGQTMLVRQSTALFSLLGVNFGGDGVNTFGLPNLQGAAPMGVGAGPGLTPRGVGDRGGTATITLQQAETPTHNHTMMGANTFVTANSTDPSGNAFALSAQGFGYAPAGNLVQMSPSAIAAVGGGAAHNNMMPYLTMTFCIALAGIFPQRP